MGKLRVHGLGIVLAAALAAALLPGAPAAGAEDETIGQVVLDKALVEKMIAASRVVFEIREQAGEAQGEPAEDGAESAEDLAPEETAELESVVREQGFKSLAEFDAVSGSVMVALMRIELDDPQVVADIKEEISRIEADTELPKDARDEMLATLRRQLEPPDVQFPQNVEVVRPFRDELRSLLEGGEPEEDVGE